MVSQFITTTKCSLNLSKIMMIDCRPSQVLIYLLGGDTMTLDDPADVSIFKDVLQVARTTPPGEGN